MEHCIDTGVDGHFDENYWAGVAAAQNQQRQEGYDIDAAEAAAHAEVAARADQGDDIVMRFDPIN